MTNPKLTKVFIKDQIARRKEGQAMDRAIRWPKLGSPDCSLCALGCSNCILMVIEPNHYTCGKLYGAYVSSIRHHGVYTPEAKTMLNYLRRIRQTLKCLS